MSLKSASMKSVRDRDIRSTRHSPRLSIADRVSDLTVSEIVGGLPDIPFHRPE
jgi:hypothetical protein